jgi:hypothetical protein
MPDTLTLTISPSVVPPHVTVVPCETNATAAPRCHCTLKVALPLTNSPTA